MDSGGVVNGNAFKYPKYRKEKNLNNITVIDAPCGQGKTTWAINQMKEHPEQAYVYCTPFLDEIDRIIDSTKGYHKFYQPQFYESTKIDDFNRLLGEQQDVAVTHSTFLNATPETVDCIRQGEYVLFIDEALDVITEFNNLQSVESDTAQRITRDDVQLLCDGGFIQIEDNGLVRWVKGSYHDGKFIVLERMARLNRVYWIRGKLMVCVFPQEVFSVFKHIYIMTYIFEGSSLCPYFNMFGIAYEKMTVGNTDGTLSLIDYTQEADLAFREKCRELITMCENPKMIYPRGLSKTWYETAGADDLKKLKNDIQNCFKNYAKAKASNLVSVEDDPETLQTEIMWTCYSAFEHKLEGAGFTSARRITKEEERKLSKDELDRLKCFVPCNARASNKYRPRWALAYCINLYYNSMLYGFFTDAGQSFDNDKYAVAGLIQWIFRSRIRDDQPIYLYLPAERMQNLYYRWLDGEL